MGEWPKLIDRSFFVIRHEQLYALYDKPTWTSIGRLVRRNRCRVHMIQSHSSPTLLTELPKIPDHVSNSTWVVAFVVVRCRVLTTWKWVHQVSHWWRIDLARSASPFIMCLLHWQCYMPRAGCMVACREVDACIHGIINALFGTAEDCDWLLVGYVPSLTPNQKGRFDVTSYLATPLTSHCRLLCKRYHHTCPCRSCTKVVARLRVSCSYCRKLARSLCAPASFLQLGTFTFLILYSICHILWRKTDADVSAASNHYFLSTNHNALWWCHILLHPIGNRISVSSSGVIHSPEHRTT